MLLFYIQASPQHTHRLQKLKIQKKKKNFREEKIEFKMTEKEIENKIIKMLEQKFFKYFFMNTHMHLSLYVIIKLCLTLNGGESITTECLILL